MLGDSKVVFLATATNGLDATAELIAISAMEPGDAKPRTYIRKDLQRAEVLQNMQYHKITPELSDREGLIHAEFSEVLNRELQGKLVFTYNTQFQHRFVNPWVARPIRDQTTLTMYDLPAFLKFAECQLLLYEKETRDLHKLAAAVTKVIGKPPSVKQTCKLHDIVYDTPDGSLPVTYGVYLLNAFWNRLKNVTCRIQKELPLG